MKYWNAMIQLKIAELSDKKGDKKFDTKIKKLKDQAINYKGKVPEVIRKKVNRWVNHVINEIKDGTNYQNIFSPYPLPTGSE